MSEELKNGEFQDGAGVPPPDDLAPAEDADADTSPGMRPPEVPTAPSAAAPVVAPAAVPVALPAAAVPVEAPPEEPKAAETKRQPVLPSVLLPIGAATIELPSDEVKPDELKWYVVTTYSGFESKAKQALEERIRKSPFVHLFGEVLVPTEAPPEGKKKAAARSFFPGYIFVQMVMNETTWTLVKGTPRVTNFVGNQKPTPVPPEQIAEIQRQISEGAIKAKPDVMFSEGDRVRVIQGPFLSMIGTVSTINPVKQVVRVLVSIFGRATPVDLEFHQVEKLP